MRSLLAAIACVPVFLFATGCSSASDCPQPTPAALADQPAGAVCFDDSSCANGLSCIRAFHVAWPTAFICAQSCNSASCPNGFICRPVERIEDGGVANVCVLACSTDTQCEALGATRGRCNTTAGDAGFCQGTNCGHDGACPAGSTCEETAQVCCPPGAQCVFVGHVGFCRNS